MAIVPILVGSLILSVTFLLRAEFSAKTRQIYFFKPLSTILIVAVIVLSFFLDTTDFGFKLIVLIGMLLCLGGDVALMFDSSKAFLTGLVLFLIGHIAYTVAILKYGGFVFFGIVETPVVLFVSLAVLWLVYPGLGKMRIPTILYMVIITLMLNCAVLTMGSGFLNSTQATCLSIGAILFYISDVVLAINKFRFPFRLNRFSLAFYFSGQLLIALSTHYTGMA